MVELHRHFKLQCAFVYLTGDIFRVDGLPGRQRPTFKSLGDAHLQYLVLLLLQCLALVQYFLGVRADATSHTDASTGKQEEFRQKVDIYVGALPMWVITVLIVIRE